MGVLGGASATGPLLEDVHDVGVGERPPPVLAVEGLRRGEAARPSVRIAPSCPSSLGNADAATGTAAAKSLVRSSVRSDVGPATAGRAAVRVLRADADADALVRTLAESGRNANAARLIGRTDNVDAVKRLVSDPDVGADARTLINRFDDPDTLEVFFELDVSRADDVRKQLARFSTDRQFSASQAAQFVEDTQVVKNVPGFDTPASPGGRSTIDDILSANDAGNIKGDQLEIRIAADRINNGETVKAIGRDIGTTDVDIELSDEIIEAKSKITESQAINKLGSFEDAAIAGDLQLSGKTTTFDSTNKLSAAAEQVSEKKRTKLRLATMALITSTSRSTARPQ